MIEIDQGKINKEMVFPGERAKTLELFDILWNVEYLPVDDRDPRVAVLCPENFLTGQNPQVRKVLIPRWGDLGKIGYQVALDGPVGNLVIAEFDDNELSVVVFPNLDNSTKRGLGDETQFLIVENEKLHSRWSPVPLESDQKAVVFPVGTQFGEEIIHGIILRDF